MDCTQKNISVSQLLQQVVASANAAGDPAIRMLNIADAGVQYYTGTRKFVSMEQLVRELIALDGNSNLAVRISLGTDGNTADLVSCTTKYTDEELFMYCIGEGVDGLPVLRITILP
jgi:hypothetical protein